MRAELPTKVKVEADFVPVNEGVGHYIVLDTLWAINKWLRIPSAYLQH